MQVQFFWKYNVSRSRWGTQRRRLRGDNVGGNMEGWVKWNEKGPLQNTKSHVFIIMQWGDGVLQWSILPIIFQAKGQQRGQRGLEKNKLQRWYIYNWQALKRYNRNNRHTFKRFQRIGKMSRVSGISLGWFEEVFRALKSVFYRKWEDRTSKGLGRYPEFLGLI